MGTCIPAKVLGESGYLAKRQHKIEHLSLVTDRICPNARHGQMPLDLSQFNCLRTLSWRGLRSVVDFEALRVCLRANALHLEDLTIDLTGWVKKNDDWFPRGNGTRSPNFFVREILGLSRGELNRMLACLRYLSLYNVSFDSAVPETLYALNFSELRVLKLWNCPFSYQLLEAITKSNLAIRLTSFEIVANADDVIRDLSVGVQDFLERFEGLKDVYLMLRTTQWTNIAEGILHHKSTLKRLVVHERKLYSNEVERDGGILWPKELEIVLQETSLECFGICDVFKYLVRF